MAHSFHQRGVPFRVLDLGIDTTNPAGKVTLAIFTALAEYDRERLEKTRAGQLLAVAQGKYIGRPKGLNAGNLTKVKKVLEKGFSATGTVVLTGSSLASVKRYRKPCRRHLRNKHLLNQLRNSSLLPRQAIPS